MAPGRSKKREGVVREDTTSECSADEMPNTATQGTFWPHETANPAEHATSSSVSTWGHIIPPPPAQSPAKPTVFGTNYTTPAAQYFNKQAMGGVTSPLPQQVTRQTPILPSETEQTDTSKTPKTTDNLISRQASDAHPVRATLPAWTKGSNSKMITEGPGSKGSKIEQVQVRPLTNIQGPLYDVSEHKDCYSSVHVEFYAAQPMHTIVNDPQFGIALADWWNDALKFGGGYMSKAYEVGKKKNLTQLSSADRIQLHEILEPLDSLLKNIEKYSDGRTVGFKLNKQRLVSFTKRLLKLQDEMEDDFVIQGEGMPSIPHWGLEGNANLYWDSNNFEILAACYREDVTRFCTTIMNVYHAVRADDKETPAMILEKQVPAERTGPSASSAGLEKGRLFDDAPISRSDRVQQFTNRTALIFENPSRNTASQKLAQMLTARPAFVAAAPDPNDPGKDDEDEERKPKKNPRGPSGGPPSGGPPGGPPSGGPGTPKGRSHDGPPRGSGNPPDPSGDPASATGGHRGVGKLAVPQFDSKLKVDVIPTWDGNTDNLGRWLMKINQLSERSNVVYQQLGYLVPTRLLGSAELWYYSQSASVRSHIEEDWGTLQNAIAGYYMNRSYLERQRARANKARYRQQGYYNETPSEYFIRKLELLEIVYNYSEGELINEIMAGAPSYWSTILAPHLYDSIEHFQMAIKFQEDNLLRVGSENTNRFRQDFYLTNQDNRNPFTKLQANATTNARVNAVGWSKGTANPPFPKDDTNVSPRGTPEDKGGRPCRHCGSRKHWDPECKYARKGERKARVNAVATTAEDTRAQLEYDELYYNLETDEEDISEEDFQ